MHFTPSRALLAAGAMIAGLTLAPRPAHATDFYVQALATGGGSTWEDDPNIQGGLHLGFEFADIFSVEGMARMGYANIDQRLLLLLGFAIKAAIPIDPVSPYLRLGAIHMHEESVAGMKTDPFLHFVGVGDAIRHRFGVETAAGIDIRLFKKPIGGDSGRTLGLFGVVEATIDIFPDEKGPLVYGGATTGIAFQYGL
ncbi:MAG: hypothetical protein U0271_15540 [Polyangiaceae bacterium]